MVIRCNPDESAWCAESCWRVGNENSVPGCKNKDTNQRHQSYACQQARGLRRKCLLIAEAGGRCTRCGYSRNLAALTWHHTDPAKKSFNLDMCALSNRSDGEVRTELAKCVLLCANCHAEEHFPDLAAVSVL